MRWSATASWIRSCPDLDIPNLDIRTGQPDNAGNNRRNVMRWTPFFAVSILFAAPAFAQTILPSPSAEEGRAPRPPRARGIATDLAVEAAQTAIASCAAQGLKVTALVVDTAATPIAMISGDGAAAITQRIASGKATTALKMKMTSGEAGERAKTDAGFMAQLMADPAMGTPRQGGVPIMLGSDIVGAIAVSGAPSGAQDEPCARAGIAKIQDRIR
jgi:uncharacterized protein GlcG (DUF336 family)